MTTLGQGDVDMASSDRPVVLDALVDVSYSADRDKADFQHPDSYLTPCPVTIDPGNARSSSNSWKTPHAH
jgi:hypothetical protein